MQVFDASSMIYAWDNYPIDQFPGLWEWMSTQIDEKKLVIPRVAFKEVADKTPECGKWLEEIDIKQIDITNEIVQDAMRIKQLIGVIGDKYHPNGVGENDLFIIATARVHSSELVSDEKRQTALPKEPSKIKIPAVCSMKEVGVPCINFIEFIKRSGEIFR
jgi:hypothetical protein